MAAALLSIGTVCTSLQRDTFSLSRQRGTRQPTFMRLHVRFRATWIFFFRPVGLPGRPPAVAAAAEAATALRARAATAAAAPLGGRPVSPSAFVLRVQLCSSHSVNHCYGRAAMVHCLSHALDIPIPPQQLDRVHLSEAMRRDVLRQPERFRRPLHVLPYGLTCPVLPVIPPWEHPISPTGFRSHLRNQFVRQIHPAAFPRLLLDNPELPRDLPRAQFQNVADP